MTINYANKRLPGEEIDLIKIGLIASNLNYKIRLDEVPLRYIKTIEISDGNIIYEQIGGTPQPNRFVVDYSTGIITFNNLNNQSTVTINYKGTGSVWLAEDAQSHTSMQLSFTNEEEMNGTTGSKGMMAICDSLPDVHWKWSTTDNKWVVAF